MAGSKKHYGGKLDQYAIELLMDEQQVADVIRDLKSIASKHNPYCLGVHAINNMWRQLEKLSAAEEAA